MATYQANLSPSERALVDRLVADLKPVRRLRPPIIQLALWLVLEAAVIWARLNMGSRGDVPSKIHSPLYLFELAAFGLLGAFCALLAFRSAVPGREPGRRQLTFVAVASAIAILSVGLEPIRTSITLLQFAEEGGLCAFWTTLMAALPWFVVFRAVHKGMPMTRGISGALTASAAFLFAFAITRIGCPIDDGLHLIVWHLLLPFGLGMVLSVYAGLRWLPNLQDKVMALRNRSI
jgi:hypothetical protein